MASFTFNNALDIWPVGTAVAAYPGSTPFQSGTDQPLGAPVQSQVMGLSGNVTFTTLGDGASYVAAAQVAGVWRVRRFSTPAASGSTGVGVDADDFPAPGLLAQWDGSKLVGTEPPSAVDALDFPQTGLLAQWNGAKLVGTAQRVAMVTEAQYDSLNPPDPLTRYVVSEDGVNTTAIYTGQVLEYSFGSRPPVNRGLPSVTYTTDVPTTGSVLTANPGQWSRGPTGYAYQWKKDGVNIGGATATTYTVVSGDIGAVITVAVTATNVSGASSAAVSVGLTILPPPLLDTFTEASDVALTSHTSDSGDTWAVVLGTATMAVNATNDRLRGNTSAAGQSVVRSSKDPGSDSYGIRTWLIAPSLASGVRPMVAVDASGNGYGFYWDPVAVQIKFFKMTGNTGTPGTGGTLADIGTPVSASTQTTTQVRYYILKLDGSTLTLFQSTNGSYALATQLMQVTVDRTADGLTGRGRVGFYNPNVAFTNSTRVQAGEVLSFAFGAAPATPGLLTSPVITTDGSPATGETVTVSNGTWTNSPSSYAYQWKRDGSNIGGATSSSYTLQAADVGTSVTCVVTATNGSGSTAAASQAISPGALTPPSDFSGVLFSPSSFWNRQYDATLDLPTADSADLVLNLSRQIKRQNPETGLSQTSGIGAPWINTGSFSTAFYAIHGTGVTTTQVQLIDYTGDKTDPNGLETAISAVPIPPGLTAARPYPQEAAVTAAGGGSGAFDAHSVIYDLDADKVYEFWKLRNWYPDGFTPSGINVTNTTAIAQILPKGTPLTMNSAAGGTANYVTIIEKTIPANGSAQVPVGPVTATQGPTTTSPAPVLTSPPGWVGPVTAGVVNSRHWFLDASFGGQGKWSCQWGGVISSASTASGYFSGSTKSWGARASSLSLAGGLMRVDEMTSGTGEINHALVCALRYCSNLVRRPAQRTDGSYVMNPAAPPQGQRFILDPAVNANDPKYAAWPILPKLIRALQKYGLIVGDTAANFTLFAEDPNHLPISNPYSGATGLFGGAFPDYILNQIPWTSMTAVARSDEVLTDVSGNPTTAAIPPAATWFSDFEDANPWSKWEGYSQPLQVLQGGASADQIVVGSTGAFGIPSLPGFTSTKKVCKFSITQAQFDNWIATGTQNGHAKLYHSWYTPGMPRDAATLGSGGESGSWRCWYYLPADTPTFPPYPTDPLSPYWVDLFQWKSQNPPFPNADRVVWGGALIPESGTVWMSMTGGWPSSYPPNSGNCIVPPLGQWFELKAVISHTLGRITWFINGAQVWVNNNWHLKDEGASWTFGIGHYSGIGTLYAGQASFVQG